MFFNSMSNHHSELDHDAAALSAQDEVRRTSENADRLKADIERLLLISEALWQILKEQHGYEDEELVRRVLEIDNRDGRIDGKLAARPPGNCPHCNRPVVRNRRFCIYCGEPTPVELFAR